MPRGFPDDDLGRPQPQACVRDMGDDGGVRVDGAFRVSLDKVRFEKDLFPLEDKPVGGHDGGDFLFHVPSVTGHGQQGHRARRRGQLACAGQTAEGRSRGQGGRSSQEIAPFHEMNTFRPDKAISPAAKWAALSVSPGRAFMTPKSLSFSRAASLP